MTSNNPDNSAVTDEDRDSSTPQPATTDHGSDQGQPDAPADGLGDKRDPKPLREHESPEEVEDVDPGLGNTLIQTDNS